MRNVWGIVVICLCIGGFIVVPIYGAEQLTITQDQIEFRSEPRTEDETIIGTLRVGTRVEWTGNTSGSWFEVHAPNGTVGWVHKSGLSAPKTISKPEPTPRPATPKPAQSRAVSAPSADSSLEKKLNELEKTTAQYKALLDEKDRRVSELTKDIETLEQKLVESEQEIMATKQRREKEQVELTESQRRLEELNATLQQKEKELLAGKIELTQLQGKVQKGRPVLTWVSYGLNALLVILVGVLGLLYVRVKKPEKPATYMDMANDLNDQDIPPATSVRPSVIRPQQTPPVLITTAKPVSQPQVIEPEEVVIELDDVLAPVSQLLHESPETQKDVEAIEEIEEIVVVPEVNDIEEVDTIEEIADGEMVEEIENVEPVEEIDIVEDVEEIEVPEIVEEVEEVEIVEAPEIIEEVEAIEAQEIIEGGAEVEVIETPEIIEEVEDIAAVEDVEEIMEVEDLIEEVGSVEPSELEVDLLPEDIEEVPDTIHDEVEELEAHLDEGRIHAAGTYGKSASDQPSTEEVDVGGEKFEMIIDHGTQIIEADEDIYIDDGVEDIEEIEEIQAVIEPSEDEEVEEILDEPAEIETIENPVEQEIELVEAVEEIEELTTDEPGFETEQEPLFEPIATPRLLEPSPILIEPEYEPAEVKRSPRTASAKAPSEDGPKYDIELVQVGNNQPQIIELLSKIKGLLNTPQELVSTLPSMIARGARESDAKNFQVVMQRLGAEIRLIKK